MELVFRIIELVRWLKWALDLIDMYDKRLAALDGPELVNTETHVKAKEQARKLLQEYEAMPGYKEVTNEQQPADNEQLTRDQMPWFKDNMK